MIDAQYHGEIRLGRTAQGSGNLRQALKHFETAIALAPERPEAYLRAGDVQLSDGNYAQGLAHANTALALPCTVDQRSFGLQLRALAPLRQYQARMAGRPRFGLQLGIGRQLTRVRLGEAAAVAQEAVQNQPNNPANHCVQAQVLAEMENPVAAEAAFLQALSLAPESVLVLVSYANFLKIHRRLVEAREMIERAARIHAGNVGVMLARGQIAFAQDDVVVARDMALWALSQQAMNRRALELLMLVKARQSWLTGPFWWFKAQRARLSKVQIALFLLAFIGVLVAGKSFLPAKILATFPPADITKDYVLGGLVVYSVLCCAHIWILVGWEKRRVKLKKY